MFVTCLFDMPRPGGDAFTYSVPSAMEKEVMVGKLVEVPLGSSKRRGYVVAITNDPPNFQTKPIIKVVSSEPLFDSNFLLICSKVADFYATSLGKIVYSAIPSGPINPRTSYSLDEEVPKVVHLNHEQELAVKSVVSAVDSPDKNKDVFYLKGITGSGKTEVFLSVAKSVFSSGGGILILVPEIALTYETEKRIAGLFGRENVAVLHSGLDNGRRMSEWLRVSSGRARVVLGARSAVFAPVSNLKLIIMDEENDYSYKSDDSPYIHARTVAQIRSHLEGAVLFMGSATPSLEAIMAIKTGRVKLLSLITRANGAKLAQIIPLSRTPGKVFSNQTKEIINSEIEKGKKVLVFLGRRGYLNHPVCSDCGYEVKCPNCSAYLTYHKSEGTFSCHICGHSEKASGKCPKCKTGDLLFGGFGVEMVEDAAKKAFPLANISRLDSDVARKLPAKKIVSDFELGKIDILVGTQMVAKGFNFPFVDLVVVVNADSQRFYNDFRADENMFALLTQVSGRAGRFTSNGRVIVETDNPNDPIFSYLKEHKSDEFWQEELKKREMYSLPPFVRFALITIKSKDEEKAMSSHSVIEKFVNEHGSEYCVEQFSSGKDLLDKAGGEYRYSLVISSKSSHQLSLFARKILDATDGKSSGVKVLVNIDPVSLSGSI